MRVLVTGATGFVGSAVVRELIDAGHQVVGLARSKDSAAKLEVVGAEVHLGSLDDLDNLRSGAGTSDSVIHTAFKHDIVFSGDFQGACDADLHAIGALGDALEGSGKPCVVTSGTAMLAQGLLGTEEDEPVVGPRVASENAAVALSGRGVRSSVVRLAPSVHGEGDGGFVPALIGIAREKGISGYLGDGTNLWPAVHRLDAARLYRLALEQAQAGSMLHAVAEGGIPLREIAEVIGRHLGVPTVSISPEEADDHFGWFAPFAAIDNPTTSALTRERMEWHPTQPELIEDLEQGHYFT